MKTKVFLDSNILLDLIFDRAHSLESRIIFSAVMSNHIQAVVTTQSLIDISYVIENKSPERINRLFELYDQFMKRMDIAYIDFFNIKEAREDYSGDYEDDAQFRCAEDAYCHYFITSDKKIQENKRSEYMTVISPGAFVELMTGNGH